MGEVEARRAPTRVPVTLSARLLFAIRGWLSDRARDRFVGAAYPAPGP
jgi:hypothetical protein